MACLGSVLYDPATAATASTASALAMTAFDTTNMRITFTAPSSGNVLVRMRVAEKGAVTVPATLLGVLESTTVMGRQAPIVMGKQLAVAAGLMPHEVVFPVTGLSAGSHTWDAAYGVETGVASTTFGWGGPNDTTASNAYGAAAFEVWDTPNLLAAANYDPGTAATSAISATTVMTALDTTNLRLTFTAPASGRVRVVLRAMAEGGSSTAAMIHLGVLESATIMGRSCAYCNWANNGTVVATDHLIYQSEFVVSGLSAGSHTWDAACAVETAGTGLSLKWGGPNDTTADNAFGGFSYYIQAA